MRRAAGPDTWVRPIGHDLRIDHHFIVEPQEWNVSEFLEEVVANRAGQALPLFGVHRLSEGEVVLVDKPSSK